MLNFKKAALGAVSLVLLCTSMASAQRLNQSTDDHRLPPTPAPKLEGNLPAVQSIDDISGMLKSLGYLFKVNKLQDGSVILELDLQSNGRKVALDIELSKDRSKVWLSAWFRQLAKDESIPSNILMQLLESNGKFAPCHFAVSAARQLYLGCPLDNRNLSAEELRTRIDIFLQVFNQTEPLWNNAKWNVQVGSGR
jgi:hypothetical protein